MILGDIQFRMPPLIRMPRPLFGMIPARAEGVWKFSGLGDLKIIIFCMEMVTVSTFDLFESTQSGVISASMFTGA